MAVASGGRRLYLFGNRVRGPDRGLGPHGGFPLDAVVTLFDLNAGKPVDTYDARLYDSNSWVRLRRQTGLAIDHVVLR